MTVAEFVENVNYLVQRGAIAADAEVVLAEQPNYPFEYRVFGLARTEEGKLAILEGGQVDYSTSDLWEQDLVDGF